MAKKRHLNLELLELPNCMGLSDRGKCDWLEVEDCLGEECAFKCSAAEYNSSNDYTFQRLASLNGLQQTYIADKYHNGRKPWKK